MGRDRRWPTALEWSCLALSLGLAWRYEWLLDDAFVYFRYVDNLLFLDLGLVYNHGEYVEGFSSPAWLLALTGLRVLHLGYWAAVRTAGVACIAGAWWFLVRVDRELSPRGGLLNLPLLYLSANYAVGCYFTSGMETPLVQLLAVALAYGVLRPDSRLAVVVISFAPLVRHELVLPLALFAAWSWLERRRFPLLLVGLGGVWSAGWELFRIAYYADLFPNTFYLKNVPFPRQGLVFLHGTLRTYHVYELTVVGLALLLLLRRRLPDPGVLRLRQRALMLLLGSVVAAYVVWIGGDPRHYRYLAFPFCLGACSLGGLPEWLAESYGRRIGAWRFAVGAGLLVLFGSFYPAQLDRHPLREGVEHTRRNLINDAAKHRRLQRLRPENWIPRANIAAMLAYRREHASFEYRGTRAELWCVRAYRAFDERVIHSLGLTDAFLARTAMPAFRPAHKMGLVPMAEDLVQMERAGFGPARGAFRRYVDSGAAPQWIARNLDRLELIERKVYNDGRFLENLRLALIFPGKIVPYGRPPVQESEEDDDDEGDRPPALRLRQRRLREANPS